MAEDRQLDPWCWPPLPVLGASGFAVKKGNIRIAGVRAKPPYLDVHEYHQRKQEERLDERDQQHSASDGMKKPPVSKSRQAADVYQNIRKAHKEEEKIATRLERNRIRLTSEANKRYEDLNAAKYLRVYAETRNRENETVVPPTPEPEENEVGPNPDDYPRLSNALAALPEDHANHIRALISMPGPRRIDMIPPMLGGWAVSLLPPKVKDISSSSGLGRDEEKEKKK